MGPTTPSSCEHLYLTRWGLMNACSGCSGLSTCRASSSSWAMTSRAGPCSSEQTGVFISWSSIKYLLSIWQSLASRLEYWRECGSYLLPDRHTGKAILKYLKQSTNDKPRTTRKWARERLYPRQEMNLCHRPLVLSKWSTEPPLPSVGSTGNKVISTEVLVIRLLHVNTWVLDSVEVNSRNQATHSLLRSSWARFGRQALSSHLMVFQYFPRMLWPSTSSHLLPYQTNQHIPWKHAGTRPGKMLWGLFKRYMRHLIAADTVSLNFIWLSLEYLWCLYTSQSPLWKWNESESRSVVSNVHGILQARILQWVAFPFSRGSSQPRDQTRVCIKPALQVDSLPAEPQGKPKNTGVGSLSLLQQIFLAQELNWGLLHCRRILYQLSYQHSHIWLSYQPYQIQRRHHAHHPHL